MLLANIDDDSAGRWRKKDEWVRVGNHIAIAPEKIITELHQQSHHQYWLITFDAVIK
jgi:putative hemolysin